MHKPLFTAIGIVLIFLFIVCLAKCPCGCRCWRWCACSRSSAPCCCNHDFAEGMTPINLTRTVTLHSVQWCPHCKVMKPVWEQVKLATKDSGIIFKEVDEDVAKTPGIDGYPTIRMVTEHGTVSDYSGGPDFATLRNWVVAPR